LGAEGRKFESCYPDSFLEGWGYGGVPILRGSGVSLGGA